MYVQALTGLPRLSPMDELPSDGAAVTSQAGTRAAHPNGAAAAQTPPVVLPPPGLSTSDVLLLFGKSSSVPDGRFTKVSSLT